jgi:uncharacterized membrane protein
MLLSVPDILALAYFVAAWIAYSILIERSAMAGRASMR